MGILCCMICVILFTLTGCIWIVTTPGLLIFDCEPKIRMFMKSPRKYILTSILVILTLLSLFEVAMYTKDSETVIRNDNIDYTQNEMESLFEEYWNVIACVQSFVLLFYLNKLICLEVRKALELYQIRIQEQRIFFEHNL